MRATTLILLSIILIGASFAVLVKNRNESVVGAELKESIAFNKTDLKTCCFYRENNEVKACRIIKRFDCSICENKCTEENKVS